MPLVLAPSFDEHTREQVEAHVTAIQARRMVAAIEHYQGVQQKLSYESEKIQKKMTRQYEMLGKELERLENAENKVLERLETLEALRQEYALIDDMQTGPLMENE